MDISKAKQAIVNGIYAAIAWLILDFGLLLEEHGSETISVLISEPEMAVGGVIVIACIVGLFYKSRLAASVLFLLFVIPLLLRAIQGIFPSTMLLIFSLLLLYFFLTAMLGAFRYDYLKSLAEKTEQTIE